MIATPQTGAFHQPYKVSGCGLHEAMCRFYLAGSVATEQYKDVDLDVRDKETKADQKRPDARRPKS